MTLTFFTAIKTFKLKLLFSHSADVVMNSLFIYIVYSMNVGKVFNY